MKKIDKSAREEILKQAIEERDFAGMWMMGLLPESCKKLKKLNVNIDNDQELRSLHTIYDSRHFIIFFIKGIKEDITTFFEVYPAESKYGAIMITKHIWRGYLRG